VSARTARPVRVKVGSLGDWSPSSIAWALGTFGFVLSSVFLIRIFYVYKYRQATVIVSEEVHRVGVLLDRHITGLMEDVDKWVITRPRESKYYRYPRPPAVLGVRAVRVHKPNGLVAEWTDAATAGQKFGMEAILIRETHTRLVSLGGELLALTWVSKDQDKILIIFDRANFNLVFAVAPELQGRVTLAAINSMEQVILQTSKQLEFEIFRGDFQYKYDGRGAIEVKDLGKDIMAFLSVPSTRGLVLVGRMARN
jgi:hypothetical protein